VVLIVDIKLPMEPSLEKLQYIIKSMPYKLTIAISNYTDIQTQALTMNMGFNRFIEKNKVYNELGKVLNELKTDRNLL